MMHTKKIFFPGGLLVLLTFLFSNAENLDSSFGQGAGYVISSYAQGVTINKVQVQGDGKIVAVGSTQNPNTQGVIIRYNTDGSLDATFGAGGAVTATTGSNVSTTVIQNVAIQTDNKIVVVGYTFDTGTATSIFVARYTTTGILDSGFGSGGVVIGSYGAGSSLNAVTVHATGYIVAAGTASISGAPSAFIVQLTSAGALDSSFGSGGIVTGLVGVRTVLNDLALDSSRNVVVGGYSADGINGNQMLLARYSSAGVLDGTFGSGGVVTGANNTAVNALALDTSDRPVVAGSVLVGGAKQFIIARYTLAGVIDGSFGSGGTVTATIGNRSEVNDLVIQVDGNIVIGIYINYANDEMALARYTSAGVLDTTFGSGGLITLALGKEARVNGIALQSSDGRVVASGYEIDPSTSVSSGVVLRCNKNNSDVVTITSITNGSSIITKIPTISGTSSAAGAQVQVVINGVLFTTVSTDGSGNWNAGTAPVLPATSNTIQVNLVVSGVTVVSEEIAFTVIDRFGEDGVFAYDTTTQAALTGSASDITFDTNVQTGTWSHTATTASFTCNKAGTYEIGYIGVITEVASAASYSASMRLVQNGNEISGSQTANSLTISGTLGIITITAGSNFTLSNNILVALAAGDIIKVQAAGSNAQLAPAGLGVTRPSAGIVIKRIA